MPRYDTTNVFAFQPRQDMDQSQEPEHTAASTVGEEKGTFGPRERLEEMAAILSCLEYLYGESVRLQARMSAHMIGAAAESMREEISQSKANR